MGSAAVPSTANFSYKPWICPTVCERTEGKLFFIFAGEIDREQLFVLGGLEFNIAVKNDCPAVRCPCSRSPAFDRQCPQSGTVGVHDAGLKFRTAVFTHKSQTPAVRRPRRPAFLVRIICQTARLSHALGVDKEDLAARSAVVRNVDCISREGDRLSIRRLVGVFVDHRWVVRQVARLALTI